MGYESVPQELKNLHRWVCAWEGDKTPMKAWECEPASSSDRHTWSDFETAYESLELGLYDYCGFVFARDGYVGIDIDCGFDEDGFLTEIAAKIIGKCHSYTERSRSGRGFHIILRGALPFKGKNNLAGLEIYQEARYFILTGEVLIYNEIVDNQSAIDWIVSEYFSDALRTPSESVYGGERIYSPIWVKPISEGRIKLNPRYPEIGQGSRNISLLSVAGALHSAGYSADMLYAELMRINRTACNPPLDAGEVQTIAKSIARYAR